MCFKECMINGTCEKTINILEYVQVYVTDNGQELVTRKTWNSETRSFYATDCEWRREGLKYFIKEKHEIEQSILQYLCKINKDSSRNLKLYIANIINNPNLYNTFYDNRLNNLLRYKLIRKTIKKTNGRPKTSFYITTHGKNYLKNKLFQNFLNS